MTQIRLLTAADIDWAIDLAAEAYKRELNRDAWGSWVEHMLPRQNVLILRGNESVVVAAHQPMLPDLVDREGVFPYWFSASSYPRELVNIFKMSIDWMQTNKVKEFWLRPINGVDAAPLARMLGMTEGYQSFRMEL